jgi:hypothetical protein
VPHSEVGFERVEAQVGPVAVVLPGEAEQEPIAGYVFQMYCQSFWDQRQLVQLFPH